MAEVVCRRFARLKTLSKNGTALYAMRPLVGAALSMPSGFPRRAPWASFHTAHLKAFRATESSRTDNALPLPVFHDRSQNRVDAGRVTWAEALQPLDHISIEPRCDQPA